MVDTKLSREVPTMVSRNFEEKLSALLADQVAVMMAAIL